MNFVNEGGQNTPAENLVGRGPLITLFYYFLQIALMVCFIRYHNLGIKISILILVLVFVLRLVANSGLAILTIGMVMGRHVVSVKDSP